MTEERMFCSFPFEYMFLGSGDHNWVCCPTWLPVPVGKTPDLRMVEDWNSPAAQEIRASILDGSFRHCSKTCPIKASPGGAVRPVSQVYDPSHREIIARNLTVMPYGPKRLLLCYDRSCNLSCPSCRNRVIIADGSERRQIDLIQDAMLSQCGPSVEELIVTGSGDPFGSPSFYELLKTLDPVHYPRLQAVTLHTNAQMWTPNSWATLSKIHPLIRSARISIDAATAETYAVNRRGGSFKRLMRNLEFIATLDVHIMLCFVVQANNYREMEAFAALGRRFNFEVVFTHIDDYGHLDRQDYLRRAIHLRTHPEHECLRDVLTSPAFLNPMVSLGNLSGLVPRRGEALGGDPESRAERSP